MAIDGLFLYNIQEKLNAYTPCKIGKIQNISDEEILIHLHTRNEGNQKLVINVHSNTNRVYIANFIPGIQPEPSNFVMVLRKLCSQAIVESFEQVGYDRILCLHLSCRNEFQDLVKYDQSQLVQRIQQWLVNIVFLRPSQSWMVLVECRE